MTRRARRSTALAAALAVVLALVVSACGSSGGHGGGTTAASGGQKKLGLAMDVLRNDKSFGQATYVGAMRAAKDFGLKLSVVDNLGGDAQKAQSAVQNLARDDDYLVNGAQALTSSLPRIASQFPNKQFTVYGVAIRSGNNLHWGYQDWYPLAYMAGIVAGSETKSNVVGFVGGGEIPPTIAGEQAYKAAVEAVNPSAKVLSTITGDFNDPAKGKDAVAAQIAQKADVIYSFLDAAHLGAVQAAKEAGNVRLIGVVVPKCQDAAGIEIGDTVSRQDELVYNLVKGMVQGRSENVVYGVQDPRVASFQFCGGEGSAKLKAALADVRAKFASGALQTPAKLRAEQGQG